ncbi:hypothetical protein [Trichococcus shcherbakoviae]|uniref:hypothetical protein n=1 Tax=Trichococcus shcherbakoviae TaxID=2094020 RepID=UPI002AA77056|nr:hypothetical protein [Trichococcus shcherbakoviae]
MENENELTVVEVVLHEFNRRAINEFLEANGIASDGLDFGKKIKQVLLVIEKSAKK